jgi:flagellar protein FlaG
MEIDSLKTTTGAVAAPPPKVQEKPAETKPAEVKTETPNKTKSVKDANISVEVNLNLIKQHEKQVQRENEVSAKMIHQAIDVANEHLAITNRMLQASVHEKTNRLQVKIIDMDTNEVIREIPPEKTLDLFAKLLEMAGILVDERK